MTRSGPTNSLVDVPGLRVGQHQRNGDGWLTGTTVVLTDREGAVGGVDVRGGAPGTRETDLLDPRNLVERVHAVCLCGGSAFGLAAADGVVRSRYAEGVGFGMGGPGEVVPIVPAAVIFDLGRGGDFGRFPDAGFGERAAAAASSAAPELGVAGAGTGARAAGLKGGVGSASEVLPDGTTVAALVVVNAVGSVVDVDDGTMYGAPFLLAADLPDTSSRAGRTGAPLLSPPRPAELEQARDGVLRAATGKSGGDSLATTIGVVATDAGLTKAQCARVAGSGHDGLARAIHPSHTMLDGDTLFALSSGRRPAPPPLFHGILTAAATVVTRAIVRGVLASRSVSTPAGTWPGYRDVFPSVLG
ncbi:MAG TPA: P1 family peptidase [Ornithinimicrobium sp.]|uniref:P1 family peptidase n=1 Tax=Ornithinimicrobium sp. TaxID=1977084 RepID=UPI002B483A1C|nr:P1 family peptidase [Ornithinimicrobium sp.]HKJ11702.1 P1 family peptidase [Ornithinimicrobium sp.]